jgi:uncharacterized OB-fold protein
MSMAEAPTYEGVSGTIVTYSVIYVPTPEFAGEAPYVLAVLQLSDGERVLARLPFVEDAPLAIDSTVAYDHTDQHGPVFRLT